ncbi:MAG TPA: nicotinate-nucleotide adenylyltransferase [Xanthomonadales bacterium]|nr:nicotinate-nucleotide adenylyltransferase [Xanthomonadales bacterium]
MSDSGAIGIFGGTFDPVHFGHLRAATEASEKLPLKQFRLLPAGSPPHRDVTFASAGHRLAMLALATANYDGVEVDDREVRRSGNSYMVDTLAEIRNEVGDTPLVLMVGQDAVNKLDSWHEWRALFELAHLVVMRRPGSGHNYSGSLFEELQPRLVDESDLLTASPAGKVFPLEVTQLEISSTGIRDLLKTGRSPRFLLPEPVIDYIYQHDLYDSVR